ncbi:MAG: DUF2811 domain-containing protein [Leptolyngbya sp. SIO1E4]|nr:DUF2811 domain-containing protein [Leptolyngbya sp. SIO1E4]
MSAHRETVFRCVAQLPLGQAIRILNPNGFEPLEVETAQGAEYCMLSYSDDERKVISEAINHPSTPAPSRDSWKENGSLWLPIAWCEEVPMMIAIELQIPVELMDSLQKHLEQSSKSIDQVGVQAIALYLIQNGSYNPGVSRIYFNSLLGCPGEVEA